MEISNAQYIIIAGLSFDGIGCLFVASEVVKRFKGQVVEQSKDLEDLDSARPVLTSEYRKWEKRKLTHMAIGLAFLISGFVLQGVGTAIQ